jgi:hypothetical protein
MLVMMKDIIVAYAPPVSLTKLVIQYGVEPQSQLDGAPASEGARGCDGAAGGTTSSSVTLSTERSFYAPHEELV